MFTYIAEIGHHALSKFIYKAFLLRGKYQQMYSNVTISFDFFQKISICSVMFKWFVYLII